MRQGYTLLELIIAVVIVAILLGFGITAYMGYINDSRVSAVKSTIYSIITFEKGVKTKYDEFLYTYGSEELDNDYLVTWKDNVAADPVYSSMGTMLIIQIEPHVTSDWIITVDRDGPAINGNPWNCTGFIVTAKKRSDTSKYVRFNYLQGVWTEVL